VKVRFQADADLNEDIVTGVLRREPSIDFQTAKEAGLRGLDDRSVLALAAKEGRILVTHDRKTMPRHFAEFTRTATSPGLLIISQKTDVRSAIEELILIWAASDAEEWVNTICTIPL
jgi:predicted nuclease of predicted toxin-antitoxin system